MPTAHRILAATLAVAVLFSGLVSAQTDEQLRSLWSNLKKQLSSANGEEYFNSNLKDTAVPTLKGTLISATFNDGESKLVLGLTDSTTPEVTLMLHNRDLKVTGEPGSQVEFQGVAIEFTKNPFMLTFGVFIEDIKGVKMVRLRSKKAASKN